MLSHNPRRNPQAWSNELQYMLHSRQQQHHPPLPHPLTPLRRGTSPPQPPFVHQSEPQPASDTEKEFMRFLRRVYLIACIFIVISIAQWLPVGYFLEKWDREFESVMAGSLLCLLAAIVLGIFSLSSSIRIKFPINCILAWAYVELFALGIILFVDHTMPKYVIIGTLLSVALLTLFYVLGAWLPKTLLPGEICICVLLVLYVVAASTVLVLYLLSNEVRYRVGYSILTIIITMGMVLYHAKVVHGRLFLVHFEEHYYCAAIVHLHFAIFFFAVNFIVGLPSW